MATDLPDVIVGIRRDIFSDKDDSISIVNKGGNKTTSITTSHTI